MSYYTLNWMQREAVRLSWKCAQKFHLTDQEQKIVDVQEKLLQKPVPTKSKVRAWFDKHVKKLEETTKEELSGEVEDLQQWLKQETSEDMVDFMLFGKIL